MILLAGLGNPGREYANTRHNIGFLFLDYLASRYRIDLRRERKWAAELGTGSLAASPVTLFKPLCYMNRSGVPTGQYLRYYRLRPETDLVVFHDEIDLPFRTCKVVKGRGAGGHNGVKSLIEHLGGAEFVRFRIGVGRPKGLSSAASHVLASFSQEESEQFPELFTLLEEGLRLLLEKDEKAAMNLVNAFKPPDS